MASNRLMLGRLGWRITLAFVLFGLALALGLGLNLVAGLKSVDKNILDETLHMELAHFRGTVETARALGAFNSRTTIIHTAPLDELHTLPDAVRRVSIGKHDITDGGRHYRVLVEELDGIRYVVMFDDTNINLREREFSEWVWWTAAGVLGLSALFGWWLARRLGGPAQQLADQLDRLSAKPLEDLELSDFQDDEIGDIARRLRRYHTELSELVTREKEFAANVSHELRTPVTTIGLAAEVLAANQDLSDKELNRIRRIQRAVREMSELVETFLVLSKIDETAGTQRSACDLKPIVERVIDQQRVWLGTKPIDVCIEEHNTVAVAAPPNVVSVLIANLVRNAFRYTHSGTITITLKHNEVSIDDTGVGIDEATQATMFERHTRGNYNGRDGAGLGLSIVKRVCDRYGWTVRYTDKSGQGSKFTVYFASSAT